MKLYSGIDLHSNNHVLVVIDQKDKVLFQKRLPNDLETTLRMLKPYQKNIQGIAVESTFNWYWLVDGLMDNGYPLHLVNTAAVKQYEGLKHTDDEDDAFWLAHLLRLDILPTGYIYPKEQRAIRDLLRKRCRLVQQRTALILSAMSLYTRLTGRNASSNVIKRPHAEDIYLTNMDDQNRKLEMQCSLTLIQAFETQISTIEKVVLKQIKLMPGFMGLQSVPGIGDILSLTIMLETGDINRFATPGNYASYCRCVSSKRVSNGKKKSENNRKNGNKYLSWAYVEAANFAIRYNPRAKRFYQRKLAQRGRVVAIKATAHKLARACYYIMRDHVAFKDSMLFQ